MPLLRSPSGAVIDVPAEQVGNYVGYEPVEGADASRAIAAPESPDRGVLGGINAAATGILSGATLGLSDYALKGLLDKGEFERLASEREGHPVASGIGQVAGAILPAVAAPGSLLGSAPSGLVSHALAPMVAEGRAIGGAAGVGRVLAAGGIEGAVQNAGMYLSDTALGDRELSAEGLAASLGPGFAFGVAGGAAALGIEHGTIAARRLFSRVGAADKAALEAESAWQAAHQSTLEANDAAADMARARLAETRAAREQAQLAKQRAKLRVVETEQAAPQIDATYKAASVEREQVRDAAKAAYEQAATPPAQPITPRLHEGLRGMGLTDAEISAMSPADLAEATRLIEGADAELAAMQGARPPLPEAKAAELEQAVAEHDAARAELDDMLRHLEAPDIGPGIAPPSREVPIGEFGAPGQRGYDPGNVKAPGPPSVVEAQTVDVTAVGKRKFGQGTPAEGATLGGPVERTQAPSGRVLSEGEFRERQRALRASLSEGEIKQSLQYTREDYNDINRFLRGDKRVPKLGDREAEIIPALDAIIDRSVLGEPIVTYRAAHFDPHEVAFGLKPGGVFEEPAFMSTSYRQHNIGRFGNVDFVITSPVGTRIAPIPSSASEGEFLLPRGTRLRITNRVEHPGVDEFGHRHVTLHATVEPTAAKVAPAATDTLTGQMRAMQSRLGAGEDLKAMGGSSRAEYAAAKAERTAAAAEHFRGEAIARHEVPEYGALKSQLDKAGTDYVEQSIPASKIAERGYYEPPGGGADEVKAGKAKAAIAEGQREPITLNVTPSGKIVVDDGRHRLAAAIDADVPVKVKWSTGYEPSADMVRRTSPSDPFFADLTRPKTRDAYVAANIGRAMREEGSHAAALTKVEREWADMGGAPSARTAQQEAPQTWREFTAGKIGEYMKSEGGHAGAMKRLGQEWQEIKAGGSARGVVAPAAAQNAVEDVAAAAEVVTKYERASAKLTDVLGPEAPPAAQEAAKAFRAAEDHAERKQMARTTRAIDDSVDSQGRPRTVLDEGRKKSEAKMAAGSTEREARGAQQAAAAPARPSWEQLEQRYGKYTGQPALPPTSAEALAAAKSEHGAADVALQRAKIAETEAGIGSRGADEDATQARAAAEAARPLPAPPPSPSTLGSIATAIGIAGEVGIPGVPHPKDIPVIGPLLSMYLKYKALKYATGRMVGRVSATGDARAAALVTRTKEKIAVAVDRTLGLVEAGASRGRGGIVAAATVLGHRVFDDGEPDAPTGANAQQLAAVRIREIANASTRPDLVSALVRKEMRGVVDPDLIEAAEKHLTARFEALAKVMPKAPPPNPYSKREWLPSPAAAYELSQRLAVVHDPEQAFIDPTPAKAQTAAAVYPKLLQYAQQRLMDRIGDTSKPVPYEQRLRGSLVFKVPLDDSLQPDHAAILATAHAPSPITDPAAPQPQAPAPSIAANTNLTSVYQTGTERRAMR